jgi:hypothetical protein
MSARIEQLAELGVTRVMLPPLPGERLDELAAGLAARFGMDARRSAVGNGARQ